MATNITRCPHCQTSFRVRDEHLKIAKGMVRCGSCLQVFQASDYFIEEAHNQVKPAASDDIIDDETLDNLLIDDDLDLDLISDNPTVDYNLRSPDSQPRPKPSDSFGFELDHSIFELADASDYSFKDDHSNDDQADDDEAWANELLNDIQSAPEAETKAQPTQSETDDFYNAFADDDNITEVFAPEDLRLNSSAPTSIAAHVADLQDDPLEFQDKQRRSLLPLAWLAGCIVLMLLAGAQYLFFKFDTLSRTPQWRPAYTQICAVLDCQMPNIQDINTLSTQLFAVSTHPRYQKALLAETLLLNKASHAQPFPDILLSFTDLNNRTIASRRFTPEQYLSGEMAGQTNIPPQVPVHIALEIVDPGAEAVSYSINLLANQ